MDTQNQSVNPAKMFVGNLPYRITKDEVRQAFSQFGTVVDVHLITDRATGRAKGFGFVEMSSAEEANSAVEGMSGKELQGRNLIVNIARPKAPRQPNFNRSY